LLYSKGRYLISITKKDKPYIDIKEDGVTLFNPFETYASKDINFLWKEIEFIDIQIETLQRGYNIVFKVETNIPKKDAKLKQNWFLTTFNEMSNENVYFTTELLDLDQDWEDIIINLQNHNDKIKFSSNRINEIYDRIDTIKKGQSIWMFLLSLLLLGMSSALYREQGFTGMHIIFAFLGIFTVYGTFNYRIVRKYNNTLERNS
jgi:hypothetical protein